MNETSEQIISKSKSSLLNSWKKHMQPQKAVISKDISEPIPTLPPEADNECISKETASIEVFKQEPTKDIDNISEAIKKANTNRQIKLTKVMYERLYGPHRDHWKRYYMMDRYYKKPGTIKADDIYCFNMEAPGEPILKKNKVSELPSKNLMEEKLKELENIFN